MVSSKQNIPARFLLGGAAVVAVAIFALHNAVRAEVPAAAAPNSHQAAAVAVSPAPAPVCSAPGELARLDRALPHTMRRLATGEPLTIVAIGSSSTAGAGASSPAASYPSRLELELNQRFPGHRITVLNRGINGEETRDMMARFARDVFAEHPQLVLWQVGTNSVLRDEPLAEHGAQMRQGIEQLKAANADVVLIDLQYSPKVLEKTETEGMLDQIALMAKEENVDLFHRFAIMHDWNERQHLPFNV